MARGGWVVDGGWWMVAPAYTSRFCTCTSFGRIGLEAPLFGSNASHRARKRRERTGKIAVLLNKNDQQIRTRPRHQLSDRGTHKFRPAAACIVHILMPRSHRTGRHSNWHRLSVGPLWPAGAGLSKTERCTASLFSLVFQDRIALSAAQ